MVCVEEGKVRSVKIKSSLVVPSSVKRKAVVGDGKLDGALNQIKSLRQQCSLAIVLFTRLDLCWIHYRRSEYRVLIPTPHTTYRLDFAPEFEQSSPLGTICVVLWKRTISENGTHQMV